MQATVDHEEFSHFEQGEGGRKMIERLAAAHGAGDPPDYLFEFVDSSGCGRRERLPEPRRFRPNCSPVPKTCPQDSRAQAARSRMPSFPAAFGTPDHVRHAEPLRITEVLC